ncbi:MAG: helix-hairpin-helix domain-containing protein, partial [Paracoccaceae bacterium]
PTIDHILDETQGIIVYQEQVMQIARDMAGYSLGGADLLRRAMGKKIQAEMDAQRPLFLEGAAENGVDKKKAMEVWDLLDKFANYGFNKSHAAAYAVVSYQTGWLKANHPVEFMAGVMNCDMHLTDKLAIYAEEVRRGLDIEIIPPCVNRSSPLFTVSEGRIVYALGALKNVGAEAMKLISEARGDTPFVNLFDVARRVDLKRIGKRPMEMLTRAGAFDLLDPNRRRVFNSLDGLVSYSHAIHEQRNSSQDSLFGDSGDDLPEPRLSPVDDWMPNERLSEEHKAIGFYLSGHPLDDYLAPLKRKGVQTIAELTIAAERSPLVGKLAGSISGIRELKSAKGNRFAFVQLSDPTGLYEVTVFSDTLEAARDCLQTGANVVLSVEAKMETEQLKLLARSIIPIDSVTADAGGMGLKVFIEEVEAVESVASLLNKMATGPRAKGPLSFCISDRASGDEYDIMLPVEFALTPQIKGAIKSLGGVLAVEDI